MKKVFSSHPALAHAWANQLQEEGRASSMYFEGPVIYSYGRHYEIARFLTTETGQKVCFVNSNGYSNSTAKHTIHVWQAIPDNIRAFKVPFVRGYSENYINESALPSVILKMAENVKSLIKKQLGARSDFRYFYDAQMIIEDMQEICTLFVLNMPPVSEFRDWDKAREKSSILRATESEREEKKKAKELQKQLDNLKSWLSGEFNGTLYGIPVHLRLINDGKEVQTTMGARVSYEAAKRLYTKIKSGQDCKGDKIDGFTVIENNPDTIKIGCHVIPWQIADNFFSQVN